MRFPGERERLSDKVTACGAMSPEDPRARDMIEWTEEEIEEAEAAADISDEVADQLRRRIYSLLRS